jgi:hypothetical protein
MVTRAMVGPQRRLSMVALWSMNGWCFFVVDAWVYICRAYSRCSRLYEFPRTELLPPMLRMQETLRHSLEYIWNASRKDVHAYVVQCRRMS